MDYSEVWDHKLTSDSVVLDVGGYLGDWTATVLKNVWPETPRVFIFEPVGEFYASLKSRFQGSPRVTVINAALSNRTSAGRMVVNGDGSAITLEIGEEIQLLDVVDFFEQYKIINVDLMSINIEGHEFSLLRRLIGNKLIERIKYLQVQFHSTFPNAANLRNEIRNRLMETHSETYCYPFVWEGWRLRGSN